MDITPPDQNFEHDPDRFALWWVLAVNGAVVLLAIRYYSVPKGAGIRPMMDGLLLLILMVAGLGGIPLVLPTLREHRWLIWPKFVVVLSLCPYPLFMLIFHHAKHLRGFVLEP
jgi:hypothetical protein